MTQFTSTTYHKSCTGDLSDAEFFNVDTNIDDNSSSNTLVLNQTMIIAFIAAFFLVVLMCFCVLIVAMCMCGLYFSEKQKTPSSVNTHLRDAIAAQEKQIERLSLSSASVNAKPSPHNNPSLNPSITSYALSRSQKARSYDTNMSRDEEEKFQSELVPLSDNVSHRDRSPLPPSCSPIQEEIRSEIPILAEHKALSTELTEIEGVPKQPNHEAFDSEDLYNNKHHKKRRPTLGADAVPSHELQIQNVIHRETSTDHDDTKQKDMIPLFQDHTPSKSNASMASQRSIGNRLMITNECSGNTNITQSAMSQYTMDGHVSTGKKQTLSPSPARGSTLRVPEDEYKHQISMHLQDDLNGLDDTKRNDVVIDMSHIGFNGNTAEVPAEDISAKLPPSPHSNAPKSPNHSNRAHPRSDAPSHSAHQSNGSPSRSPPKGLLLHPPATSSPLQSPISGSPPKYDKYTSDSRGSRGSRGSRRSSISNSPVPNSLPNSHPSSHPSSHPNSHLNSRPLHMEMDVISAMKFNDKEGSPSISEIGSSNTAKPDGSTLANFVINPLPGSISKILPNNDSIVSEGTAVTEHHNGDRDEDREEEQEQEQIVSDLPMNRETSITSSQAVAVDFPQFSGGNVSNTVNVHSFQPSLRQTQQSLRSHTTTHDMGEGSNHDPNEHVVGKIPSSLIPSVPGSRCHSKSIHSISNQVSNPINQQTQTILPKELSELRSFYDPQIPRSQPLVPIPPPPPPPPMVEQKSDDTVIRSRSRSRAQNQFKKPKVRTGKTGKGYKKRRDSAIDTIGTRRRPSSSKFHNDKHQYQQRQRTRNRGGTTFIQSSRPNSWRVPPRKVSHDTHRDNRHGSHSTRTFTRSSTGNSSRNLRGNSAGTSTGTSTTNSTRNGNDQSTESSLGRSMSFRKSPSISRNRHSKIGDKLEIGKGHRERMKQGAKDALSTATRYQSVPSRLSGGVQGQTVQSPFRSSGANETSSYDKRVSLGDIMGIRTGKTKKTQRGSMISVVREMKSTDAKRKNKTKMPTMATMPQLDELQGLRKGAWTGGGQVLNYAV